jgi:hypothetical protein
MPRKDTKLGVRGSDQAYSCRLPMRSLLNTPPELKRLAAETERMATGRYSRNVARRRSSYRSRLCPGRYAKQLKHLYGLLPPSRMPIVSFVKHDKWLCSLPDIRIRCSARAAPVISDPPFEKE